MPDSWQHGLVSNPLSIGGGVAIRVLKLHTGRFELAVVISDDMTAEQLRGAWAGIDKARLDIRRIQGSDMQRASKALIWNYEDMYLNGYSYRHIAMDINYDCMVHLCHAIEEVPDLNIHTAVSEGISYAVQLMRTMRMKDKDILEWIMPALNDIKNERAPWSLDNGPISDTRVRDTLRQWKKEQHSEMVVVKAPPERRMADVKPITEANKEWNEHAKRMLKRTYPDSLAKYERMALKMVKRAFHASSVINRTEQPPSK